MQTNAQQDGPENIAGDISENPFLQVNMQKYKKIWPRFVYEMSTKHFYNRNIADTGTVFNSLIEKGLFVMTTN